MENKLKIFKVSSDGHGSYGDFVGHVVVAKDEGEALDLVYQVNNDGERPFAVPRENAVIKEVSFDEPGIILSDYIDY